MKMNENKQNKETKQNQKKEHDAKEECIYITKTNT